MYWDKEFNFQDKDIRHMYKEYAAVVVAFTGVVIIAIIIGALM